MSLLLATTISFFVIVCLNSKTAWEEPINDKLEYGDAEMVQAYEEALSGKE